jgi:type II secretion system protein H
MKSVKGFTLIELMVVVVMLGIFAAIAVPSFSTMIEKNRVEGSASELYRLLLSARSDAVTKRSPAIVAYTSPDAWNIQQQGQTVRGYVFPSSLNHTQSVGSLTFSPDGTGSAAVMTVSSDRSNTLYTVTVRPSGSIRLTGPTTPPTP